MHIFIKPDIIDKTGPGYKKETVDTMCRKMIETDIFFSRKVKQMTNDTEKAIELLDDVEKRFSTSLDRFQAMTNRFTENSKIASGNVRDATTKLSDGLSRIEKAANFDRLERYVELIERASSAMLKLSELESSGKLKKISEAIK